MSTSATVRGIARAKREAVIQNLRVTGLQVTPDALLETVVKAEELGIIPCAPSSSLLHENRAAIDWERRRIAIDSTLSDEQRRFSLAHELGHWFLEGSGADCPDGPHETDVLPMVGDALITGYSPHQPHEAQASLFAAEFLAPADKVSAAFEGGEPASSIATRFGVSQAVVHSQLLTTLLLPQDTAPATEAGVPHEYHPKQCDAISAGDGPHCIDAGPGTGKTRTLTARVKHLIEEREIPAEQILCLTFSNKAAAEMRERIEKALGERARQVRVRTFHAFGLDLLRDYPEQAGVANDVTLLDTVELLELLERNLVELGLESYRHVSVPGLYLESIVKAISRAKDEMVDPAEYARLAEAARANTGERDAKAQKAAQRLVEVARVYAVYEQILARHGAADYGDLIYRVVRMLEAHSDLAEAVGVRWPHVLVDEYQDVNRASAQLLGLLHKGGKSLWVVGDIRQAIYGFRGAASDNLRLFREDFPAAGDPLPLVRNYRSARALVRVFSSVAVNMRDGQGFADWEVEREDALGEVVFATAANEDAELTGIADRILSDPRRPLPYSAYAVLCHRNEDVQLVAEYLAARGVPVANFGNFMEREEVRDLLALLSMHAEYGATALPRVGRMKSHEMHEGDLEVLLNAAVGIDGGLPAVMRGPCPERMEQATFDRFQQAWRALSAVTFQEAVWQFYAEYLFEDGRYIRRLLDEETPRSEQQLLALGQLLLLARTFDARHLAFAAEPLTAIERKREFLRYMRRLWSLRDGRLPMPAVSSEAVYVGTVHSAKGLEFGVVFIPFLEEGRFPFEAPRDDAPPPPDMIAVASDAPERELEALFFVAMTRAQDGLYFSRSATYGKKNSTPSRLLALLQLARSAGLLIEQEWTCSKVPLTVAESPSLRNTETRDFRYTELSAYQDCPRKFYYRHVLDLPSPGDGRAFLPYRSATDAVLDWLEEQHRAGTVPQTWDEVQTVLEKLWSDRALGDHPHSPLYREEAEAYVHRVWMVLSQRLPGASSGEVVAGEIDGYCYSIPVAATRVSDEEVRITHRYFRNPKPNDDKGELRFTLLRHALATNAPEKRIIIEADYPRVTMPIAPMRRDAEETRINTFRQIVRGINTGVFPPAPKDGKDRECPRCPYSFVCPR
jgi:superfamily I DNA/RNA helicase